MTNFIKKTILATLYEYIPGPTLIFLNQKVWSFGGNFIYGGTITKKTNQVFHIDVLQANRLVLITI